MLFNVTQLAISAVALACSFFAYQDPNPTTDMQAAKLTPRTNLDNGIELRIYPLGDSITNGYQSTDDNGYRIGLQRNLAGSKVLFVGSKTGGTMTDGWNEGWNGATIDQIADKAKASQHLLNPNIILLHAGTNDLNPTPPIDPDHAPARLGALIDQLIQDGPDAVILVAQIINAESAQTQSLIQKYNDAIPGVVAHRAANHKIAVVDFRNTLQSSDHADDLHPNDSGYPKMANVWYKAILNANGKGWIKAPSTPDPHLASQGPASPSGQYCLTKPFWVEGIKDKPIGDGVGHNGDRKFHTSWAHKPNAAPSIGKVGAGVLFADLNGDGRADYLFVNKTTGSVIAYYNNGRGNEFTWDKVLPGSSEIARGLAPRDLVRFVDIDFDGRDDYVVIGNDTGSVTVWLNRGLESPAGHFNWDGPHEVAPGVLGTNGKDVLFSDINGDGRPDYLVKHSNGAVDAFLNIGKPKTIKGIQWLGVGQIAGGFGTNDISIADISGDGRADYLIWSSTGGITGYLNYRTEKEGAPGWSSMGPMGSFAGGVGPSSAYCRLADLNGDGRADYLVVADDGSVDAYFNEGVVDTSVIGDGVRLADMDGNGLDDYIHLDSNAAVTLFLNGGRSEDGQHWIWDPAQYPGNQIANGAGASRDQILFADMNGDGKDDFCIVHPDTGGLVVYINDGAQPNGWGWKKKENVASGIGGPGKNVRLADLDGDGKADYILLGPNGEATLLLNKGEKAGGWNWDPYHPGHHIAEGIGSLADFVQFKDVDGDGKADYIGMGQLDGSAIVYKNLGPKPDGWGWAPMNDGHSIASGVGAVGRDVRWGRMEKTGRNSYLTVSPNSGALRAWLNGCDNLSPATSNSTGGGPSSTGSSSGSGTDSGTGSRTGPGNSNAGQYLQGGLPIPTSGDLGSLGLPTSGIPAIASLTPYAITAQNALTTANEAIILLTSGTPTSATVTQAVAALTIAALDLTAVAQQAKGGDLTSLDPGLKQQAQQGQQDLQAAAKTVSNMLPRLESCVSTPQSNECKATFTSAAKAVSDPSTMVPGGGSGGGGSGGGGLLGGGLPIPSGGLESLGLPTSGGAAIDALKPYAITTQNAITTAWNLLKGLGAGSSAGQVSAAADALAAAGSDFTSLSGAADAWELDSFGPGGPIFSQVQTEQTALRTAAKSVADSLSQLRNCISTPGTCKNIYDTVAGALIGGSIGGPLAYIIYNSGTGTSPTQASKASSPAAATSEASVPEEWLISTVPGTSVKDFQAFIKGLPDRGSGEQIIYPELDEQGYITKMTELEAAIANRDPIVDVIISNAPIDSQLFSLNHTGPGALHQRDEEPWTIVLQDEPERYHAMLCAQRTENVADLPDDKAQYNYVLENSAGDGIFVYVLDHGCLLSHEQFAGRSTEPLIVPGVMGSNHQLVTTIDDEAPTYYGHGTAIAALVNGKTLGVAKKATVVCVKYFGGGQRGPSSDLYKGWRSAISDVKAKNRQGKAVFVTAAGKFTLQVHDAMYSPIRYPPGFAYAPPRLASNFHFQAPHNPPYNVPRPKNPDIWPSMMVAAWSSGIVTLGAVGNIQPDLVQKEQGSYNPQRYATANNAWINAASVNAHGAKSYFNLPPGPNTRIDHDQTLVGSTSIYAHAEGIRVASKEGHTAYLEVSSWTSWAAGEIAGLAAYYLGLPNTVIPSALADLPMKVKNHLVNLKRGGSEDAEGLAYNGVWESLCGAISKRAAKEAESEASRIMRKLKGLDAIDD